MIVFIPQEQCWNFCRALVVGLFLAWKPATGREATDRLAKALCFFVFVSGSLRSLLVSSSLYPHR